MRKRRAKKWNMLDDGDSVSKYERTAWRHLNRTNWIRTTCWPKPTCELNAVSQDELVHGAHTPCKHHIGLHPFDNIVKTNRKCLNFFPLLLLTDSSIMHSFPFWFGFHSACWRLFLSLQLSISISHGLVALHSLPFIHYLRRIWSCLVVSSQPNLCAQQLS